VFVPREVSWVASVFVLVWRRPGLARAGFGAGRVWLTGFAQAGFGSRVSRRPGFAQAGLAHGFRSGRSAHARSVAGNTISLTSARITRAVGTANNAPGTPRIAPPRMTEGTVITPGNSTENFITRGWIR
jgi:hypothetical protein